MNTNMQTTQSGSTALAALATLKQGLANVQTSVRVPGGEPIMRLGRDGVWLYGPDNVEVEEGSEWAFNPLSIRHGYVCWKVIPPGAKDTPELFGRELVPMTQPIPLKSELQAYDKNNQAVDHNAHPWDEVIGVDIKCLSGDDAGEETIYEPSSTGGLRAMKGLIAEIMQQLDKDPAHPVPVVVLESDSYQHKTYGKTYYPVLRVVRWISMDGAAAPADGREQAAATAHLASVQKDSATTPAPAPAPEPESAVAETSGGGERRRRRRG